MINNYLKTGIDCSLLKDLMYRYKAGAKQGYDNLPRALIMYLCD